MAVAPTGAIFKALTFDGESSRPYGLYITGEGVYNAPEREVEMVTIPGRNGAFALDRGRFENIAVTYPAGIYADTPEDFADAISEARNWLTSKRGYVRLSDDYNPDEYRLAVYKSGLDVKAETLRAGEFDLEFEAMPQRWLTSGEESQAVASGGTITNPTRFAARPLLEVNGYGAIEINGETVSINAGPLGTVELGGGNSSGTMFSLQENGSQTIRTHGTMNTAQLNAGDAIAANYTGYVRAQSGGDVTGLTLSSVQITKTSGDLGGTPKGSIIGSAGHLGVYGDGDSGQTEPFTKGTARTAAGTYNIILQYSDNTRVTATLAVSLAYDGADRLTLTETITATSGALTGWAAVMLNRAQGYSTKSAIGEPAYIDLDIGEAYKIEGGAVVGINNGVTIPGDLPELEPGANSITYDNTITGLNIVPRWWKV